MAGSVGLLALTLLLSTSSLYTTNSLGSELSKTASVTARNLEQTGEASEGAAQMLSAERGLLLQLALGNQDRATKLHAEFAATAKQVGQDLQQLRSVANTAEGQNSVDKMHTTLTNWLAADATLWQLCNKQDYQGAFKIFNENVSTQAVRVEQAASDIVATQHHALEQAKANAAATTVQSRWMIGIFSMLSLCAGFLMVWVVRATTKSLTEMALRMATTAEEVIQASQQISSLSEQLASGASEQAGSLEETSASSTEISSMTQQNAAYAQTATGLVVKVDEQVQQANRNLEQMLSSMQEINDSSNKVAQIITVIEKIAFQTNLLALNAAVEAARAGEAGLGFAVVADEVRSLAQRCSEAARDTGALITAAVTSCNDGSAKLSHVDKAIAAITESTVKVREMFASVSAASQEQARGISQISEGLSRMERVTQQTAASAEEGSAASRQMDAQARALQEVVHDLQAMVDDSSHHSARARKALEPAYA
jgi:methyl-accepting chemotaxis protein/methyl-accepting chemotaxis protein-1 (serine sensor receptor)